MGIIEEGQAKVKVPDSGGVFYNPVQCFNRDMSVAVIKSFVDMIKNEGKKTQFLSPPNILEALSATGLRAIRYAKEIDGIGPVIANDFSEDAVEAIKNNVILNELDPKTQVVPNFGDASLYMFQNRVANNKTDGFAIIDLDPYGSASPFLDSAVQSVKDGGLLCVTCTDMAVLSGNYPEVCWSKYGSMPTRSKFCHENALRVLLHSIDSHANRYKRFIVPLISCSIDFYIRVFVRVFTSADTVKHASCKRSYYFQCTGCESYWLQTVGKQSEKNKRHFSASMVTCPGSHCPECNRSLQMGGPIWTEPIHDQKFVEKLNKEIEKDKSKYATFQRMRGFVSVISEELPNAPLYYSLPSLAKTVHTITPPILQFRSALMNLNHKVSYSHCADDAVKTDAPPSIIWEVMRRWAEKNPVVQKNIKENSPSKTILDKKATLEVDFTERPDANPPSRKYRLQRFPENPQPNWGPLPRAKKRKAEEVEEEAEEKDTEKDNQKE